MSERRQRTISGAHDGAHRHARGAVGGPTLWQEGHWSGDRVIRLSISLSVVVAIVDIAVTGRLDLAFDIAFVLVCVGAALAVRPGDFFDIAVLPPLLLLGCCAMISLVRRSAVASDGDGFVQGVISGLAEHSGSLAAGYVLLLALLAIRQRVLTRSLAHSNRLGSPLP